MRHVKAASLCALAVAAVLAPGGSPISPFPIAPFQTGARVGADLRAGASTIASVPFQMEAEMRAIAKAISSFPHEFGG